MAFPPDSRIETDASGIPARRTRVLLADDSEHMMREIEYLMAADFDIAGKATNGMEMVSEAARLRPDLIVTDLEMPELSGIEASRAALKECPGMPIVLLTSYGDRHLVQEALRVGIRAYVLKPSASEELIPAAHGALRGETFVSPSLR
jgi:DNA-binding NarL/FixJ family response regulator